MFAAARSLPLWSLVATLGPRESPPARPSVKAPSVDRSFAAPACGVDQLIDIIIQTNPTATREYLAGFDEATLADYATRLAVRVATADGLGRWVRPCRDRAISWRDARE